MKPRASRTTRTWTWAAIAGVIVLVWFMYLVRVPVTRLEEALPPAPSVRLVDPVINKETMLLDPTPLFLPTAFNSSRKDYVPLEPDGAFAGFEPKLTFDPTELELNLPSPTAVPGSPADALAGDPPGAPFIGFGRANLVVEPVGRRGAYVEIAEAGSGRTVFGKAVADAHPPASSLPWQPMEFMAAVDSAGLVGSVVPTTRSGIDEVDAYFGRYLVDTLRVGQRLAPGFYRISVGP